MQKTDLTIKQPFYKKFFFELILFITTAFFTWFSFTLNSTKTEVLLIKQSFENEKKIIYSNQHKLEKRVDFMSNAQLLHENHELRITLIENILKNE